MYINKQPSVFIENTKPELLSTNGIKLKISSSSKNYPNINYCLLPKLSESEKSNIPKKNDYDYSELEESSNTDVKSELEALSSLWDELGITEDYKYHFNQIVESNIYNPKIMFYQEKENLQKFKTSLMKLKKEIKNRENNINNLIKKIKIIEAQKEANQSILKEVINIIKNLRLNAMNIVIYINRVRELGFYYYFQGKWDLIKIKDEYLYNNNYLLQMNEDLNFIKNSCLNEYINFGNGNIDAFLTNCSQFNQEKKDDKKIIIPIADDLLELIEQSIFFVVQDQILDNIYTKKSLSINKTNNINSMPRASSNKIKIKKVHRPITSKNIFNNNVKYRNLGRNDKMKNNIFNELEYNNLFHLSTKLLDKKNYLLPESTRIKNRFRNNDEIKMFNNSDRKKIKVEHELISSLSSTNGKNRTFYERNLNSNNSNNNEIIMKENEELKKDNQVIKNELQKLMQKMEENEKFKKKIEDKFFSKNKDISYGSNSVEEIKIKLIKDKKD